MSKIRDLGKKTLREKLSFIEEQLQALLQDKDNKLAPLEKIKAYKTLFDIIWKADQVVQQQIIDFSHPKITKSYVILMKVFTEAMRENGVDDNTIKAVSKSMSVSLIGFEDKLNALLGGKSLSAEVLNIEVDQFTTQILQSITAPDKENSDKKKDKEDT